MENILKEEVGNLINEMGANPTWRVDINKNDTKKGIKIQFTFPNELGKEEKAELTQKIQLKLNTGLAQYALTTNVDNDVPYPNVIGFLIRIQDIQMMIKKACFSDGEKEEFE